MITNLTPVFAVVRRVVVTDHVLEAAGCPCLPRAPAAADLGGGLQASHAAHPHPRTLLCLRGGRNIPSSSHSYAEALFHQLSDNQGFPVHSDSNDILYISLHSKDGSASFSSYGPNSARLYTDYTTHKHNALFFLLLRLRALPLPRTWCDPPQLSADVLCQPATPRRRCHIPAASEPRMLEAVIDTAQQLRI